MRVIAAVAGLVLVACTSSEETPRTSEFDTLFVEPSISTADPSTLRGIWSRAIDGSATATCVVERMAFTDESVTFAKRCSSCKDGASSEHVTVGVRLGAKLGTSTVDILESGEQRTTFDGVACDAVLRAGALRYELRDKQLVIEDVGAWQKVAN